MAAENGDAPEEVPERVHFQGYIAPTDIRVTTQREKDSGERRALMSIDAPGVALNCALPDADGCDELSKVFAQAAKSLRQRIDPATPSDARKIAKRRAETEKMRREGPR